MEEKFLKNVTKYNYKILVEDLNIDNTNVLTLFEK